MERISQGTKALLQLLKTREISETPELPNNCDEIKQVETEKKKSLENNRTSFPKAVQYADEILEGKYTFDSLKGQVPDSWIDAVQAELESREYLVLPENGPQNSKEKNSNLEYIESVNNKIKQELLLKVDTTFKKQVARDLQRSNIESYTGKQFYTLALNEYYKYLRTADYPRDPRFDFDIDTVTVEPNQLIKRVTDENGWHYRIAQTSTSANKAYARISLNVVGNKKLVESLDKIAYRYGIYYKTPDQSDRWDERTDPITIYINNPNLTPEFIEQLKQEVINETTPYIRDNKGFGIYGENISTGVEYGPENSTQDIQQVKQEAKDISEEFYQAVNEYLMKEGKEKGSVGQIMTVKKIINMFLNEKHNNKNNPY